MLNSNTAFKQTDQKELQAPVSLALPVGVSVVIPVYNGAATLNELTERLQKTLSRLGKPFEIIFVNDASQDQSWKVIGKLSSDASSVRGINLVTNCGQQNALLCGIRQAQFDTIVTLDDDLQHPPEEIPKLLLLLNTDSDVVYGVPLNEAQSVSRTIPSRIIKRVLRTVTGIEATKHASAFRAFRTSLRVASKDYQSPFVSVDVLLSWGTRRFATVAVEHHPRKFGSSGYSVRKLFSHAITMLTGFSVLPLHLVSIIGFLLTIFGCVLFCYVLGRYLWLGGSVPGFPFLAAALTIFSGAQVFALGIIGEYLARMHFRLMGRPMYVVGEQVGRVTRASDGNDPAA